MRVDYEKSQTTAEFIKNSQKVYGDLYDYSNN